MPIAVPIPAWTAEGLIPPHDAANPTSSNRAPYPVSLTDFVLRFSTSPQRIAILTGFLNYRAALHAAGLVAGFQWIDGSFVEHIEVGARSRSPGDVDVVTFYHLPTGETQASLVAKFPALFPATAADKKTQKDTYLVDAYSVSLGTHSERLVDRSAYWYGVWSHQKDTLKWKGFLQLDLAPVVDADARLLLTPANTGGTP
jgi:hypothetical protein